MLSSNAVFVVVCVAAVLLIGLVCVMYADTDIVAGAHLAPPTGDM
jgi:hypothetical protein